MAQNETPSVETPPAVDPLVVPAAVVETPAVEAPPVETTDSSTPVIKDPAATLRALGAANKEAESLRLRLKEFEDRDKSEAQLLQEERDRLATENDTLRLDSLRRDVAAEKGLTTAQARRLVGSTREELESDADDLLTILPAPAAPTFTDVGQGHRDDGAARRYRQSELKDHTFFMANKADILKAQREGRIDPD